MAKKYCEKYFYPERYNQYKCNKVEGRTCPCECYFSDWCYNELNLTKEEFAILDSLRVVKVQNLKIMEQNKKIIEELALQQLQKYK